MVLFTLISRNLTRLISQSCISMMHFNRISGFPRIVVEYITRFLFADKDPVFIIFDVLVKITRNVTENIDLYPKYSSDSYKTNNGQGYLKFDDFTFYPKYVIHYKALKPILTSIYERMGAPNLLFEDWTVDLPDHFPLYRTIDMFKKYDRLLE